MGLSYSFLRAGARQVISTLWSVDDTVSKELMTVFYQKMTTNGNDSADALRQSQLTVMHRHHSSDPYYWAGFELSSVGN
jgi:CHAT domain-containing protein